jgi:hypothetical protein
LIERSDAPVDASLGALLDAVVVDSPNSVCRTVMQRLVGDRVPRDDIAVLAVRRTLETTEEPHSSAAASPVAAAAVR